MGGDECGVGSAETERHAETLRRADRDVRAQFARGGDQRASEQVRGYDDQPAEVVNLGDRVGASR